MKILMTPSELTALLARANDRLRSALTGASSSPVPPEVLAATAAPMIHHRSPDFRGTLERV